MFILRVFLNIAVAVFGSAAGFGFAHPLVAPHDRPAFNILLIAFGAIVGAFAISIAAIGYPNLERRKQFFWFPLAFQLFAVGCLSFWTFAPGVIILATCACAVTVKHLTMRWSERRIAVRSTF